MRAAVKLGLLIVGMVGGLIVFIVRIVMNSQRAPTPYASRPTEGGVPRPTTPPRSMPPPAVATPVMLEPAPSKPVAAMKPQSKPLKSTSNSGSVAVVIGFIAAAAAVGLLAIGLGVVVVSRFVAPAMIASDRFEEANDELARAEAVLSRLEDFRQSNDAALEQFDERWRATADELDPRLASLGNDSESLSTEETLSDFPPLNRPAESLPVLDWSDGDIIDSGLSFARRGMSFADRAPSGGVLVGLRVTGDDRLRSVQPIFQQGDRYILGKVHGQESSRTVDQILARPGYAVSAMRIDLAGAVFALQLEFGLVEDERISPNDRYASRLVGRPVRQSAVVIEGEGDFFVGIGGWIDEGFDGLRLQRNAALGSPENELPEFKTTATTQRHAGQRSGNGFSDTAPSNGILVGLRFFTGRSWGGAIRAVQPIYQVSDSYHVGDRYGPDGGVMHQVLARPGYAIGGVDANVGLVVNSAQVTFQRIADVGLDTSDRYTAPRIGSRGGAPHRLNSGGRFIVGVGGSFREDLTSLEVGTLNR